jgi:hypothetical protein
LNINAPVDRRDLWRFISFYFLSPVYLHLCVAPASWFAVLCFCLSLIFFFFFIFIYLYCYWIWSVRFEIHPAGDDGAIFLTPL